MQKRSPVLSFNTNLPSGFYKTNKAQVNFPYEIPSWPKKHLIVSNSWGNMLHIASTAWVDDKLYFRKVNDSSNNPSAYGQWNEVATRGTNTFTGKQIIKDRTTYTGEGTKIDIKNTANADAFTLSTYGSHVYVGYTNHLYFKGSDESDFIVFGYNGSVGIGTFDSTYKLNVNGTIRATEIRVETNGADFVFAKDYVLPTLDEVKAHIDEHKHLPGIPSEAEVQENGIGLSAISTKLLQKVEELTLYAIQQKETIEKLNNRIDELEKSK